MAKKELTPLQAKRKKFLTEKIIMQIIYFTLSLAPIVTLVITKRETYFTYKNGLSISIGGILSAVAIFLLVKKQFQIFHMFKKVVYVLYLIQ